MTVPDARRIAFRRIAIFLSSLVVLSGMAMAPMLATGDIRVGGKFFAFLLMWSPGLSALLTQWLTTGSLRGLGWRRGRWRWLWLGLLLPLGYCLVAYGAVWLAGMGRFAGAAFVQREVLPLAHRLGVASEGLEAAIAAYGVVALGAGLAMSALAALGEEIGWRGLLIPQLCLRYGYTRASLIGGLVWSVWHWPLLLFADYHGATPRGFGLLCFTVMVVAMSFIMAWLRLRSGSIWATTLMHASHNLFVQGIFTPLTGDTGSTGWFIDEFGVALPLIIGLLAAGFWVRRRGLRPEALPDLGRR